MPRNSSGVYSLPAGNPVVTNTTITSTWANTTMPDIGSELTNSLDRSGRGGMLAALRGVDGAVGTPSYSFTAEPTSGLFRKTTNIIAVAIAGSEVGNFQSTGWNGATVGAHSGTMTGTADLSAVSAQPFSVKRLTTGGIGALMYTDGATYGIYQQFAYNNGANIQGFIGSSKELISGGLIADFAIRAESNLLLAISNAEIARVAAGGFGVGGTPIASLVAAGRGVITVNGSSDAVLGLGVGGVAKGNIYSNGTDMTITNQSASGNLALGTNSTNKWGIDATGRLFTWGITPGASALEVFGGANTAIFRQGSSSSYAGIRVYNDLNTATRALELDYSGSAYASALLTSGPTGEQAAISTTGNFPLSIGTNGVARIIITGAGSAQYNDGNGTLEIGWKSLRVVTPSDGSSLVVGFRACMVVGAFTSLTVPNSVFNRGDMVTIYQDSSSAMTLTQGAGVTLRLGGTSTTGNRTIAGRGIATILFNGASEAVVSGPGVS